LPAEAKPQQTEQPFPSAPARPLLANARRAAPPPPPLNDTPDDEPEEAATRGFVSAHGPRAGAEDLAVPRAEPKRRSLIETDAEVDPITVGAISREHIALIVRAMPLDVGLRELGKIAGYTMNVSAGVQGTIRDRRLEGTLDAILDRLSQEFGLFWFNDGFTIHVDPREEQKTRFVRVAGMTKKEFDTRLAEAGLTRFSKRIQLSTREKLVRIVGSESFISTVEATLAVPVEEKTRVQIIRFGVAAR